VPAGWEHGAVRAVLQRVSSASVSVGGEIVGEIGRGLCVLLGVTHGDDAAIAANVAAKIWNLRVFDDEAGVMNRSAAEVGAAILLVSQFTPYGDTSAGRRPSWIAAARPEVAEPLVDHVAATLRSFGAEVATGRFRSAMQVALVNDGPVTVIVDRD
jgi:D-tyrosyl-tRNA(Tyr) deacylase